MNEQLILSIMLSVMFFNVLPVICVLVSVKAHGVKKLIWLMAAFCFSWLGYIVYYVLSVRPYYQYPGLYSLTPRDENGMPLK